MSLDEKTIWDKLDTIRLALNETCSTATKLPRSHVMACVAKYRHGVDDACKRADCPTCDALESMRDLLGG